MSAKKRRRQPRLDRRPLDRDRIDPYESRASVALTVAWTVSVTTVLICNLAAAAAHVYARSHPNGRGIALLCQFLLLSGAVVGAASLLMLPAVYRVRRNPPPTPLVVFSVFAAIAPILAIVLQLAQQS